MRRYCFVEIMSRTRATRIEMKNDGMRLINEVNRNARSKQQETRLLNLDGILLSTCSRSAENLFSIRPVGFVSKKRMGALRIDRSMASWILTDAARCSRIKPYCQAKAMARAMQTTALYIVSQ